MIESTMSMPDVRIDSEPRSERRRVASFIRSISIRRLSSLRPRVSRRQPSLPVETSVVPALQPVSQSSQKPEKPENTTSNSSASNEQHSSPTGPQVQESNTVQAEGHKNTTSPIDDHKHAPLVNPLDTAGGVEPRTIVDTDAGARDKRSASARPKSRSSSVSATLGSHNKLRKPKSRATHATRALTLFRASLRKPRGVKTEEQNAMADRQTQLGVPSSLGGESLHSGDTQPERKDVHPLRYVEDGQKKAADVKDAQGTVTETEEIERLRRDLTSTRSQISELQKRCEAQSRDLESSNNFLNTADKSSDLDIILALQRLNAEVQQNTTYMADCVVEDFEFENTTANLRKEQTSAAQKVSDHIGYVLAKSLRTENPEEIPMLLQIAFQAYLASALCQTASSWCFEPGYNAFIDGIYQRLHRVEAQAISGRWRSLARIHIVHSWIAHPEPLAKGIITGISDIMLAAGCTAAQSDIMSKVTSRFGEKIAMLVGLAGRLNKMFDDVISSDFEVFSVRPGEKFDGKNMEDSDGSQVGIEVGPVLCATHLGLIKHMPTGTLWERGRKQKMMVLKAKVLLESFLATEGP